MQHQESVCPRPTSSVRPLGWGWGPPCTQSWVRLEGEVRIPPKPKELCRLLHWQRCVTNPNIRGSLDPGTGCSEMYDFAFAGHKSKTIPCRPFLYGINSLRPSDAYMRKLTITGSDNGLSPGGRQAIIWTNDGILLIGPSVKSWTKFIYFHSRKCIWKCRLDNGVHFVSASMS